MNATSGYVITEDGRMPDRRLTYGDRRGSTRKEIKIHYPSVIYTSLLWLILVALSVGAAQVMRQADTSTIKMFGATAPNAAAPGDLLAVVHGVSGQCAHPDGGMIIAEAMAMNNNEWRLIKRITANPMNLEPGAALSKWRIPKHWKPGAYVGRITVWCYGAKAAQRSKFNFHVR